MEDLENKIKFSDFYKSQAIDFKNAFPEMMPIFCPEGFPKNLKKRQLRVCRFCGKSAPDATFKNDSHVFPKALGNAFLISDFECDRCNNNFSRYEDDLMKYLGLSRTLSKVRGRKLNPGFVSKDIKASKEIIFNSEKVLKIENKGPLKKILFDRATLQQSIEYTKPPYIPINVFKALYKMALSIVPSDEMGDYYLGFEFLKHNFPINFKTGLVLHEYRLQYSYENISGWLFSTSSEKRESTVHTFVLLYDSFMIQILLPFNRKDFARSKNFKFPVCPPFFDATGDNKFRHRSSQFLEMSSNKAKSDDTEKMIFQFNKEELLKTAVFDPKSGQVVKEAEFDFENIASVYVVDSKFTYNPKTGK